jgi:hypothetical protein
VLPLATAHRILRHRRWQHAALLGLLALGLRCYHLGHESFWIDEATSMRIAASIAQPESSEPPPTKAL